jgi:predicted transcriptional regulator
MNKELLRSVMVLHGDTNRSLAASLGITEQSVSNKMNENGTEFKQGEISQIKTRYNLTSEQIDLIFFAI